MNKPVVIPDFRIGTGFDVHRLVEGRPLVLGGVVIPWDRGLLGHSDADVLLHALMDAILGALALGDIGHWFPPSDPTWKGASSLRLLETILHSQDLHGWEIRNVDLTLLAEKPRIAPYHTRIRESLAGVLGIPLGRVSLKATTTEGLGYTGRGEGMAAQAAVLLCRTPEEEGS